MPKSNRSNQSLAPLSTPIAGPTISVEKGIFHTSLDRRHFLRGSAFALLGMHSLSFAQEKEDSNKSSSDSSKVKAAAPSPKTKKPSEIIAEFVTGFDLKNVPPAAIDNAQVAFIDTVGVMLAGSRMPVSDIVCEMVKMEGSAPAASIVGQSLRASPQLAALANGVAAHAMDYDFTYFSGQSVSPVIPAILPVAENLGASPAESIAAFIIGCEVASRLERATPGFSDVGGWATTGVIGTIAAAAACARLLKTPVKAIPDVIGISVSMASAVAVNYGTMTKPMHSGNGARNGILAALLGTRGLTADASALERPNGYFSSFARGVKLSLDPFNDLGRVYDLVEQGLKIKCYPCGGRSHTSIDAALALRDSLSKRLSDISSIKVGITKVNAKRLGDQYPSTVESAKFSIPYLIAYALVHGAPLISAFTEEALRDERVKAVAKTVSLNIDPEFADETVEHPTRVKVALSDGQTMEQMKYYACGTPEAPMSQAQIQEKFLDCASRTVSANVAKRIFALLNTLRNQPSFKEFWPLLRRS